MKRLFALGLLCLSFAGCRFKGPESFVQATTPNPPTNWAGDAYSWGGIADATGGLQDQVQYGTGARKGAGVFPSYDDPAKGTGLQPGEIPGENVPWWAGQNAPAWQPRPGEIDANNTRVRK